MIIKSFKYLSALKSFVFSGPLPFYAVWIQMLWARAEPPLEQWLSKFLTDTVINRYTFTHRSFTKFYPTQCTLILLLLRSVPLKRKFWLWSSKFISWFSDGHDSEFEKHCHSDTINFTGLKCPSFPLISLHFNISLLEWQNMQWIAYLGPDLNVWHKWYLGIKTERLSFAVFFVLRSAIKKKIFKFSFFEIALFYLRVNLIFPRCSRHFSLCYAHTHTLSVLIYWNQVTSSLGHKQAHTCWCGTLHELPVSLFWH